MNDSDDKNPSLDDAKTDDVGESKPTSSDNDAPQEVGGQKGPEPTRFGDWEKNGRCIDF